MTKSEKNRNAKVWNAHVKAWETSGLSQASYCRQHNLSPVGFSYWLRKHRRKGNLQLIPVSFQSENLVSALPDSTLSGFSLRIGTSASLEIPRDFDPVTFEKIVRVIVRI